MNMPMLFQRFCNTLPVMPLALATSLVFSLLLIATNSQLNDDAFSYLRAAERFQQDGLSAVIAEYGWYGYSVLIALADHVLPGGLLASARALNTLCYLLLVWTFVAIQREHGAAARQQWLAALLVLLLPLLNEMRPFVIRDVAYWAFTLLALLHLMRFAHAGRAATALAWCACSLLATVFRIEALLPTVLAPLVLAASLPARGEGLRRLVQLYGLLGAGILLVLGGAVLAGVQLPELIGFAWRYYLPLLLDFGTVLRTDALAVSGALFTPENFPGSDNVGVGLLVLACAGVISVLLNLAGALGLPCSAVLLWSWQQRSTGSLRGPATAAWLAYATTALLALLVFQFIMHFQTQRYATLLALLLLVPVPGFLEQCWQKAERNDKARRFCTTLAVVCALLAIDGLVSFGYSKRHLEQAEQWLRQELPAGATLATNSFQLAWRSGRIQDYDRIRRDVQHTLEAGKDRDYVVMVLKHGDAEGRQRLQQDGLALVTRFSNERGDEVVIYRRQ